MLPLHCTVSTLTPAYRTRGTWSQIPLKGSVPQKKANYPLFVDKEGGGRSLRVDKKILIVNFNIKKVEKPRGEGWTKWLWFFFIEFRSFFSSF